MTPPLRLEVAALTDRNVAAVLSTVSRHPPFATYSFGLMVHNLLNQLRHGANMMAIAEGRLVAYAGWLRVGRADAEAWRAGRAPIPPERWSDGDAAVVTIVVSESAAHLPQLLRGVSHVCAGMPVYRMRSFQDGRPDMIRPPITGRRHDF